VVIIILVSNLKNKNTNLMGETTENAKHGIWSQDHEYSHKKGTIAAGIIGDNY
jgi:hypothetical protein